MLLWTVAITVRLLGVAGKEKGGGVVGNIRVKHKCLLFYIRSNKDCDCLRAKCENLSIKQLSMSNTIYSICF